MSERRNAILIGGRTKDWALPIGLAAAGWRIAAADPSGSAEAIPTEAVGAGGSRFGIDLGDAKSVESVFERVVTDFGAIDALVFVAPYDAAAEIGRADTGAVAPARWRDTIRQLLNGAFFCTRAALRAMIPRKAGRIIFVCADEALRGSSSAMVATASTGILGLMSSLSVPSFEQGVNLNAILVGRAYRGEELPPEVPPAATSERRLYTPRSPAAREAALQRLHHERGVDWSRAVAGAIDYLCSDPGGLVAGATLRLASVGRKPAPTRWTF